MKVKQYQSMINSRLVTFTSKDYNVPITLDDLMLLDLPIYAIGETVRDGIESIINNIDTIPNRSKFLLPTLKDIKSGESRIVDKIRDTGFSEFISGGYIEIINSEIRFRVYTDLTHRPQSDELNPYTGSKYTVDDILYTNSPSKSNTLGWIMNDNESWVEICTVSNSKYVTRVPSLDTNVPPADYQLGSIFYSEKGLYSSGSKINDPALYLANYDPNSDSREWLKLSITKTDIELYESSIRHLFDDKLEQSELLVKGELERIESNVDSRFKAKSKEIDTTVNNSITSMTNNINKEVEKFNTKINLKYNELMELETSRAKSMKIIESWIANKDQFKGDQGLSAFEVWKLITNQPNATESDYLKSIKGQKGDVGEGISVKGTFKSESELPKSNRSIGDSYIINEFMYIWNGSGWNKSQIVGPPGPPGKDGSPGREGKPAEPFRIVSVLSSESNLPSISSSKVNESYIINGYLYVFDTKKWTKLFKLKGEDGAPGKQGPPGEFTELHEISSTEINSVMDSLEV